MLAFIRGTANQSDLKVEAFRVDKVYQKGLKVADDVMKSLNIERHPTCPKWNRTIWPRLSGSACTGSQL
jgi:hypothetical protein